MAMTPAQQLEKIREKLGHLSFEWRETSYLDTGFPDLNEVLGDPALGLPYGRITEISGLESHGKSALCLLLAAIAQQDGAVVIWGDFENSWNNKWAAIRGVNTETIAVVQPFVGTFGKEAEPRMSAAEELCTQIEELIKILSKKNKKIVLVLDSLAAMVPGIVSATNFEDANLVTDQAIPKFLSRLFRRWVGLAQAHNVMILAINQLRQNPMQRFGDPWYTPGGNAMRFYAHVRVRVQRSKGGKMMGKQKQTGIQGHVRNIKNKAGGLEKSTVGYRLFFAGPMAFVPSKEIEKAEE
jgi:RecA/RadA recombinase